MKNNKILVLGGYGNAGFPICDLLLKHTNLNITVAGRDLIRARKSADSLNVKYGQNRAEGIALDATQKAELLKAMESSGMILSASSTSHLTEIIAGAAIQSECDYFDIQVSGSKIAALKKLHDKIEKSGLTFITDGGFHPGLPAAMIRYSSIKIGEPESAIVGSLIRIDWKSYSFSRETLLELVDELRDYRNEIFYDGKWLKAGFSDKRSCIKMNFKPEFGNELLVNMLLEEMKEIPRLYPGIRETGFFVGGTNWAVNYFVMPLASVLPKYFPGTRILLGNLLQWALKTFSAPPYMIILKLSARGKNGKFEMVLRHVDGYYLTAAPVIGTILQYLDGSVKKRGLCLMAHYPEPVRLFSDLRHMGIEIKEDIS